ncbi:hypothetical protein D3C78_1703210 [compost metagenome]
MPVVVNDCCRFIRLVGFEDDIYSIRNGVLFDLPVNSESLLSGFLLGISRVAMFS